MKGIILKRIGWLGFLDGREVMWRLIPYGFLLSLFVFSIIVAPMHFFVSRNLINILQQSCVLMIGALGVTFVIIMGSIDISLGSVLALSGLIGASIVVRYGMLPGILAAMLTGMLCGSINGFVFSMLKVPSLITTLGMMMIARGLAVLYCRGNPIVFSIYSPILMIGCFPGIVYITLSVLAVCYFFYKYSIFGREIRAIGGDERVAGLTGVPLKKVKFMVFFLCGTIIGVAGIVLAARCGAATATSGFGFEFSSITAVVLGGTPLTGSIGSVQGAVVGGLIMTILGNILTILGVSPNVQTVIMGIVFIIAVSVSLERKKIGTIK